MSLVGSLQIGCLAAFALLLLAAAWQDLRTLHIADALSIGIVCVFLVWAVIGLGQGTLSLSTLGLAAACAAGMFAAGAAAFALGSLGGGDVKLLAAASLFAGPALLFDFVMVTALAGGLLSLAILAGAPIGPAARPATLAGSAGEVTDRARLRGGLPYGPAIAAGGLWVAASLALAT
jgi:prepilin peptidase CpaA